MSRLLCRSATDASLPEAIPPGTAILEGNPTAATVELLSQDDRSVGLWEMTAGRAADIETDEVFVVVAGSGTVSFADGESIELRPGTIVRLQEGDRTEWTVTETLRKIYFA